MYFNCFSSQITNLLRRNGTSAVQFGTKPSTKSEKLVGTWLFTCSGMVFVAVVLGTLYYLVLYGYIRKIIQLIVDMTYGK